MYGVDFIAGSDLTDWVETSRGKVAWAWSNREHSYASSRPLDHKYDPVHVQRRTGRPAEDSGIVDAATESRLHAREPN